mmetsp:Transcript_41692/g.79683  ORF Transcript_41692/g.79683 Transcript_41692/m.79683 type:complete len:183 (+) Transcript_41692:76-624(+)|eukprot:CAMPEP_0114246682 /NCGR_PEP_ID=MMETSP0058-20121206/12608_1 /TAXON_ID=36894 /ORGANISM="Pyramimonas parkeae, CCMP726" /LENGTH=182 /DNA_ID=CAMNT_0001359915 /DNA_START=61 /DNA_END=609 /DNA_ORIENTATION=+
MVARIRTLATAIVQTTKFFCTDIPARSFASQAAAGKDAVIGRKKQPSAGHEEFVAARREYKLELSKLRIAFSKQFAEADAAEARVAAAKDQEIAQRRSASREAKQQARKIRAAANIAKFAEFKEIKAQEREEKRAKHVVLMQRVDGWREKQRKWLQDQSMVWIEEHELEQRIHEAIDNPKKL